MEILKKLTISLKGTYNCYKYNKMNGIIILKKNMSFL